MVFDKETSLPLCESRSMSHRSRELPSVSRPERFESPMSCDWLGYVVYLFGTGVLGCLEVHLDVHFVCHTNQLIILSLWLRLNKLSRVYCETSRLTLSSTNRRCYVPEPCRLRSAENNVMSKEKTNESTNLLLTSRIIASCF